MPQGGCYPARIVETLYSTALVQFPLAALHLEGGAAVALLWLAVAAAALLGVIAGLVYLLWVRFTRLDVGRPLESLPRIESALGELASRHADLDLRRLEHVLIDVRDGQRRLEARLLSVVESLQMSRDGLAPAGQKAGGSSGAPLRTALVDRITSRLLALGFERVELLTPAATIEKLAREGGDVRVEARRDGVPHKGRVRVRGGAVADVELRAAYPTFP